MNERIKKLYDTLKGEYELGTIEEFIKYLENEESRKKFFDQIIEPNFEVESFEIFEQAYGLKKKDDSQGTGEEEVMVSSGQPDQDDGSLDVSGPQDPQVDIDQPGSSNDPTHPNTGQPPSERDMLATQRDVTASQREQANTPNLSADIQEKNTWIEDAVGKNFLTDFVGDIWRAGKQGFVQGNTSDEGWELMLKGADSSPEDILEFMQAQEEIRQLGETDEMKKFNQI